MRWWASISAAALAACGAPLSVVPECRELWREDRQNISADAVEADLVIVLDSDAATAAHVGRLLDALAPIITPQCVDANNLAAPHHPCDPQSASDWQIWPAAASLRVGVVSADLGARGSGLDACETDRGDDGRIGLVAHDAASARRQATSNIERIGVEDPCDAIAAPRFLQFCSDEARCEETDREAVFEDASSFDAALRCRARRAARGCSYGQPLEALWRALVLHGAADPIGSPKPNAGFLRPNAPLHIVVLSANEDHSVRDCRDDHGFSQAHSDGACADGTSAFLPSSARWASADVDARFYLATPSSEQDPTWSLDRYLDHRHQWSLDLDSLKPGRPWLIRFTAVVGAPIALEGAHTADEWVRAINSITPTLDPACGHVRAACVFPNATSGSACRSTASVALPARRIIELARRFSVEPRCAGGPCNAGSVVPICRDDLRSAFNDLDSLRIPLRSHCAFVSRPPRDEAGFVPCIVTYERAAQDPECDPSRGAFVPRDPALREAVREDGTRVSLCEIAQIPALPATHPTSPLAPASDAPGWFIDERRDPLNPWCAARHRFLHRSTPPYGRFVRWYCATRELRCGP